jgi:CDP-diacylglycerol--glycerol-3-phosphate 3-phosphatidyltransferase
MNPLKSLPNILTLMRIFFIPVFVMIFYLPVFCAHQVAACIFALACFTDWLDGFLARKLKQMSPFGAFLDPVADKLIVATCLLLLVGDKNLHYITIPSMVIVGREIVISALREWMAEIGSRASVMVCRVGKIKTFIQIDFSWLGGRVVMQRPAKPWTPVRFRPQPPKYMPGWRNR